MLIGALARSLAAIPAGQAREDGIQLGRLVASRIIQSRAADNPDLPVTPPTSTATGRWGLSHTCSRPWPRARCH